MADIGVIRGVIELEDKFTSTLEVVERKMNASSAKLDKVGTDMVKVGGVMSAGITLPLVGIATQALLTGETFGKAMNAIEGVMQPVGGQMDQIRALAIKMGAETAFSATDAATAMLELGKAGFTTEQAMASVDEVMQLAAAASMDMGQAAEIAARTMNAFGLQTQDLGHINDVLAAAVNKSSLNIDDLRLGFQYVGPVAQGFGLSLEQVSAALGIMRDRGVSAETAGRSLREAMNRLANPTNDVTEVMEKLGIKTFEVNGKMMPLNEIIGVLAQKGLQAKDALKLFGDVAGGPMLALVKNGQKGLEDFTEVLKEADGDAKKMADAMMKGLPGALEKLRGSVETAWLSISAAIEPAALKIIGVLEKTADIITNYLVPAFQGLPSFVQTTIVVVLGLAAAIGPVLLALGGLQMGLAVLAGSSAVQATIAGISSAFFTLGNTVPVLTARLAFLEAAGISASAAFGALAIAIGAIWIAWKIGNTEKVKNGIAEWALSADNLTAKLFRAVTGQEKMTKEQARLAVAATAAAQNTTAVVTATDKLGAAYEDQGPPMEAFNERVAKTKEELKAAEEAAKKYAKGLADMGGATALAGGKEALKMLGDLGGPMNVLPAQMGELATKFKEAGAAAMVAGNNKLAGEYQLLAKTLDPLIWFQQKFNVTLNDFATDGGAAAAADGMAELNDMLYRAEHGFKDVGVSLDAMGNVFISGKQAWTQYADGVEDSGERIRGIRTAFDEAGRAAKTAAYDGLASFFTALGQISGSKGIGKLFEGLGGMVIGLKSADQQANMLGKNGEVLGGQFGSLSTVFNSNASGAARFAAGLLSAASIAQGAQAIWKATGDAVTKAGAAFNGAMAGAQAGAVFGPWGAAAGAAAGLVVGLFRDKVKAAVEKANKEIDKLKDGLLGTYGSLENLDRVAARVGMTFADNWGHQGPEGLARMKAMAEELEAKLAAVALRSGEMLSGFNAAAVGIQASGGASVATLAALENQALLSITGAVAAGMTWGQAFEKAGPGLDMLRESYKTLGIESGNQALTQLLLQDEIISKNATLIAGIDGMGLSLRAASDLGLLNVDTFKQMTETGDVMYQRLQAAVAATGGTTRDALLPMQQYLHEAENAAKKLGIPLDENTAMLIDQSKELGIWQEQGEDATSKLLSGMTSLVDAVNGLVSSLMGVVSATNRIPSRVNTDIVTNLYTVDHGTRSADDGDNPGRAVGSAATMFEDWGRSTTVDLHNREAIVTPTQGQSLAGMVGNAIRLANQGDGGSTEVAGEIRSLKNTLVHNNAALLASLRDSFAQMVMS